MTMPTFNVGGTQNDCGCCDDLSTKNQNFFLARDIIENTLNSSTNLQNVLKDLESQGYIADINNAQSTNFGEKTIIDIPIISNMDLNDCYIATNIVIGLQDGEVYLINIYSVKHITDGFLYMVTNEKGDNGYFIVKGITSGDAQVIVMNEGFPLWGPDWGCVSLCLTEFGFSNPEYMQICGSVLVICLLEPTKATCLAALICFGPPALYCLGQCWSWWW